MGIHYDNECKEVDDLFTSNRLDYSCDNIVSVTVFNTITIYKKLTKSTSGST